MPASSHWVRHVCHPLSGVMVWLTCSPPFSFAWTVVPGAQLPLPYHSDQGARKLAVDWSRCDGHGLCSAVAPEIIRLDANVNKIVSLGPDAFMVLYASVNNLLGRENIYQYTWTRDYTRRIAVPSLFNRSFYFGAILNTR